MTKRNQPKCTPCLSCYGKKYYTQLDPGGIRKHECPRCKGTGLELIHMPSMVLVGKPRPITPAGSEMGWEDEFDELILDEKGKLVMPIETAVKLKGLLSKERENAYSEGADEATMVCNEKTIPFAVKEAREKAVRECVEAVNGRIVKDEQVIVETPEHKFARGFLNQALQDIQAKLQDLLK